MRSILALSLLLIIPTIPALAADTTPGALRIGLDHSFRHSTILLISCEHPFSLTDAPTHRALAHGYGNSIYKMTIAPTGIALARLDGLKEVAVAGSGMALIALPGQSGCLKIARMDNCPAGTKGIPWHRYRGFLTVRRDPDNALRVVNTVPLEPYLYGVLPAEIGTKVPFEAMKAQAVAARTYALKNRGKCAGDGFDLDDTTRCEGYEGVDGETAASNAAVDGTRGQILAYQGQMIDAPYSTDSGGMTACDDSGDCPYLQAVRDGDGADGRDYAADGRYHTWTQTWTPAQLAQTLARDPRTKVAQFMSLTVDGLDASGRITTATAAGADGTLRTVTGPQLRQILGYDSLRSTRVTLTRTPTGDYRFDGKGWGHGLGMSQDGAVAMAGPPYRKTYREILKHYYVGAVIASDASVSPSKVARHGS